MKIIPLILIMFFSVPVTSFAQEREYDEKKYVFLSLNVKPVDDVQVDCVWAQSGLALELADGATGDLYALQSRASSGQVVKGESEKIGTITACWDVGQPSLDNGSPSYDAGVVYWIVTEELNLAAVGTLRIRTEPGYPQSTPEVSPDMALWGAGATVWRLVDGEAVEMIGSMTSNSLTNPAEIPGYDEGGIVTLRLFSQRNYEWEAILEALVSLFPGT